MRRILVLMSTYNGEKYLKEQLDSILNQSKVEINILIRDDGSNDLTLDIIREYKNKFSNIEVYNGKNIGPAKSFLDLIYYAKINNFNYDYYAFADQDDVWLSEKLNKAVEKIQNYKNDKYILYGSCVEVVDKNLNFLYKTEKERFCDIEYFLRNNIAGCTMVFNNEVFNILNTYKPEYLEMHDSWVLRLVLSLKGCLIFDDNSYILYRQHGKNAIGSNNSFFNKSKYKINNLFTKKQVTTKTCKELLRGFSNYIDDDTRKFLNLFEGKKNLNIKYKIIKRYRKVKFSTVKRRMFFYWDCLFNNL